ncbi:DNA cytosine methyltransferase [Paenibacillus polymyxa]|uniref:DNA cytosine methyltransferase n=1 Tax=Paenibacillus polymyxa TaxID=1406 RepID=UPI0006871499|nr:DNA cytosine methyltransferase [Paenibacillus polymyxa]WPQ59676.1 DNA cytosine methyltransferase [Paenibacillus polymyxa]
MYGIISKKHLPFFMKLMNLFIEAGYDVSYPTKNEYPIALNCWDYGVPQLRKRVIVVGIRKDLDKHFEFPPPVPLEERTTIRDAIGDLPCPDGKNNHQGYGIRKDEIPYVDKIPPGGNWRDLPCEDQIQFLGKAYHSGGGRTGFLRKILFDQPAYTITSTMNGKNNAQIIDNQDKYYTGGYSPRYKSRNRQKQWHEPSFTIVSQARQLPLYPEPPYYDIRLMDELEIPPPRRFTVRECLRLQTVPDWFSFGEDISLAHQYERCSGIPSLMAYKLGLTLAEILNS